MSIAATPVPLSEAKARLSELARRVRQQHERITLTRNGEPEAVLLSAGVAHLSRVSQLAGRAPEWTRMNCN